MCNCTRDRLCGYHAEKKRREDERRAAIAKVRTADEERAS